MTRSWRLTTGIALTAMSIGCANRTGSPVATKEVAPRPPTPAQPSERAPAEPSATPSVAQVKPPQAAPAPPGELREVFPHVRVDAKAKVVEFDGFVPIDAHDKDAPLVFLEVVACTVDTKEHEALVATQARPSHVHAALLLIGLEPGTPGKWEMKGDDLVPVDPTGAPVEVSINWTDESGARVSRRPAEMVTRFDSTAPFNVDGAGHWLFAGSQMVTRAGKAWYDADGAGTLIGLTTFGSETIAWSRVISPDASVQEPEWVAKGETVPRVGTAVTVRLSPSL